jgi:hypothetical protein
MGFQDDTTSDAQERVAQDEAQVAAQRFRSSEEQHASEESERVARESATSVEGIEEDEAGLVFMDDDLSMTTMKQAKAMYDADTFRSWKRARKKALKALKAAAKRDRDVYY